MEEHYPEPALPAHERLRHRRRGIKSSQVSMEQVTLD